MTDLDLVDIITKLPLTTLAPELIEVFRKTKNDDDRSMVIKILILNELATIRKVLNNNTEELKCLHTELIKINNKLDEIQRKLQSIHESVAILDTKVS
ncbi:MAG: hypothetical protein QXF17_01365 [Ignisphaera sp.]